jgi:hypothetical protein
MKALFAAVVTSASLVAGLGVNVDSPSSTPAVETLVARNEVQVSHGLQLEDVRVALDTDALIRLVKVAR